MADILTNPKTFDEVKNFLIAKGGTGIDSKNASSMFTVNAIKAPFAKYKPVVLSSTFKDKYFPSRDKQSDNRYWWHALNDMCGFDLSTAKATDFTQLPNKYVGGMNGWVYDAPTGGATEPFRIADFNGYNATAKTLITDFVVPKEVYQTSTSDMVQIAASIIEGGDALTLMDFPTLKEYYLGAMFCKVNSTTSLRLTSDKKIKDGGLDVKFDPTKLTIGDYKVYPFLCNYKYAYNDNALANEVIYTLPLIDGVNMTVKASGVTITITAVKIVSTTEVEWSVTIISNSTQTFTNNKVWIHKFGAQNVSQGDGEVTKATLTVPANSINPVWSGKTKISYQGMTEKDFKEMDLWIDVTLQDATYKKSQQVMHDFTIQ